MQEDIKILEELRKELGLFADGNKIKQGQSIEHLIKAYKEKEADLYSANSIINEQIDVINNSVDKDKIKEIKKKCELENMPCEFYNKESRNYWMNIGQISLCTRLLEGDKYNERKT